MALEIIGAGFGRTGTMSIKLALEQLGFGPCYHMAEVFLNPQHVPLWLRAANGEAVDWDALFAKYRSSLDWPACTFWREHVKAFPRARVLLTARDPDVWYESMAATIFRVTPALARGEAGRAQLEMAHKIVYEQTFGGRVDDRAHCIDVYVRHNREVQRELGSRVLTYDVSEGWQPLCEFLGVAVPETPMPRTNSASEFQRRLGLDKQ